MRELICVIAVMLLASCGGRVARPVQEVRAADENLSCSHIKAKSEVNAVRVIGLLGEEKAANDNNAALLLAAPVSIGFPVFLDLGDAEQQEIKALEARNRRLNDLGASKGCPIGDGI